MKRKIAAMFLVCLALGAEAAAADASLKVFCRRDAATEEATTGQPNAPGFVALVPVDPKGKLALVTGQLRAELVLPKVGDGEAEMIALTISLESQSELVTMNHFRVAIPPAVEAKIDRYLRGRNNSEYAIGHRFEPVIAVRGFTVNGTVATAAVVVPTYLELAFDEKTTNFEDDAVVFRGVYIPQPLLSRITDVTAWSTDPQIVKPLQTCQVAYDGKANRLTFHFLNRAAFIEVIRQQSTSGKNLDFLFLPPAGDPDLPAIQPYLRFKQPPGTRAAAPIEQVQPVGSRPATVAHPGQNLRFGAAAPPSNWEMPLYLKGAYTHSADSSGKTKDVANLEVDFNMDDKLWAPLNFLTLKPWLSIAPALNAKVNTTGIVNDENSIRFRLPLKFSAFPRACCRTVDKSSVFHIPFLRESSTYVGFLGEAARTTATRTYGGLAEERLSFARARSTDYSFKAEPVFGWESGHYQQQAKNTFVEANQAGVVKGPDGKPVSATSLLKLSDTYSRLHAGIHSTLTLGPVISLVTTYDMWRLLRAESFFDSTKSANGLFTPYPGQTLPTEFTSVDSSVPFIAAGQLLKGTRRYFDISMAFQLNKFFDLTVEYSRGELPPNFQFVNKVALSLAFKIVGKDSLRGN